MVLLLIGTAVHVGTAGNRTKAFTNSIGMKFVRIPGGTFSMGSDEFSLSGPIHQVTVGAFWMGCFEVTNIEFEKFKKHKRSRESPDDKCPVTDVSHEEALAYAAWLGKRDRLPYKLPSEAQWEYAARGGLEGMEYPWGNESPDGRANVGHLRTTPVGTYPPNGFGLYDMAGNAAEMVLESWYPYTSSIKPKKNPVGPMNPSDLFITRGGSVDDWMPQVWVRSLIASEFRLPGTGFRLTIQSAAGNLRTGIGNYNAKAH